MLTGIEIVYVERVTDGWTLKVLTIKALNLT